MTLSRCVVKFWNRCLLEFGSFVCLAIHGGVAIEFLCVLALKFATFIAPGFVSYIDVLGNDQLWPSGCQLEMTERVAGFKPWPWGTRR